MNTTHTVLCGLGQGCVLSAILFLMFIRTITEPAPIMQPGYRFEWLENKLYGMRLSPDDGVMTMRTRSTRAIPAMICADDTTLVSNTVEGTISLCSSLFNWKKMCCFETNDSKFHLLVHRTVRARTPRGAARTARWRAARRRASSTATRQQRSSSGAVPRRR